MKYKGLLPNLGLKQTENEGPYPIDDQGIAPLDVSHNDVKTMTNRHSRSFKARLQGLLHVNPVENTDLFV